MTGPAPQGKTLTTMRRVERRAAVAQVRNGAGVAFWGANDAAIRGDARTAAAYLAQSAQLAAEADRIESVYAL